VNVARDWNGGLQEPSGLKCPRWCRASDAAHLRRVTKDAMVKQAGHASGNMKTEFEASVLRVTPTIWLGLLCEPGRLYLTTGCTRYGYVSSVTRFWRRSGQPGVYLSTYSITGSSIEHMNLNPSAWHSEAKQAAKSGDVLDEGRSLRCSPSTGKPCTWR
jgi:hypothetical protein